MMVQAIIRMLWIDVTQEQSCNNRNVFTMQSPEYNYHYKVRIANTIFHSSTCDLIVASSEELEKINDTTQILKPNNSNV